MENKGKLILNDVLIFRPVNNMVIAPANTGSNDNDNNNNNNNNNYNYAIPTAQQTKAFVQHLF